MQSLFEGKVVLAPMVRAGTLPMRLLALEYGADLVWSPETVDKKIISCERVENYRLGTIDYIIKEKNSLVLRTHPRERSRFIFQLGSADPELAVKAALRVRQDVSGIDLNCGCPKRFSLQAGMGAALLSQPDLLCSILRRLVQALPELPVSAKIRLLPDLQQTLDLVKQIAATGISALTVHCRTPAERPRNPAHHEFLPEIVKLCPFPVIVNGDMFDRALWNQLRDSTGVKSVMLARPAMWNPSIFQETPDSDIHQVTKRYLEKCIEVENRFGNCKYTVLQMWIDRPFTDKHFTARLQSCKSMVELCAIFDVPYSHQTSAEELIEDE